MGLHIILFSSFSIHKHTHVMHFSFVIHEAGHKGYEMWHRSIGSLRRHTTPIYRQELSGKGERVNST